MRHPRQVLELFSEDDGPPLAMGAPDALDALAQLPPPLRLPAAQRQLDAALEECFRSVAQHVSAGLQLHSCTALATDRGRTLYLDLDRPWPAACARRPP